MLPPPGALGLIQPRASACCSYRGIVTIVTATTPSNASAAIIAITAIDVSFISKPLEGSCSSF
jgi:hypothetical protein